MLRLRIALVTILVPMISLVVTIQTLADETTTTLDAQLVKAEKIWDHAEHSAFTDLIRWNDQWYCAFREADSHVGTQGVLCVIRSVDGNEWTSAGVLSDTEYDLRDAKLSAMPDGRLMIVGGAQVVRDGRRLTGTFTAFSSDGSNWTNPQVVIEPGRWLWDLTWHDGVAWGVSYATPDRPGVTSLLTTTDGLEFKTFEKDFFTLTNYPNEARIRFADDGTALCLHRSDGREGNEAYLGVATPPYRDWKWSNLGQYLGGPNLIQLPGGEWLAAGRVIEEGKPRTALLQLFPSIGSMSHLLTLPSGGDCSYPGLAWHDDRLCISYYSSHEGKTSIYWAEVAIQQEPKDSASP